MLILDFRSQYTQLIARRVREIGVYCEIHPWDVANSDIRAFQPMGIILSGGPESTLQDDAPRAQDMVWQLGVPVLGICYGMQTMAAQLGGKVGPETCTSSATPRSARAGTASCCATSRIASASKATGCSTSG